MDKSEKVYKRLQRHLNRQADGFPSTSTGTEINLLKHIFSPRDAPRRHRQIGFAPRGTNDFRGNDPDHAERQIQEGRRHLPGHKDPLALSPYRDFATGVDGRHRRDRLTGIEHLLFGQSRQFPQGQLALLFISRHVGSRDHGRYTVEGLCLRGVQPLGHRMGTGAPEHLAMQHILFS